MELDEKINSQKIGSNNSRTSAGLPPNITIKREHDDLIFYNEDDMSYVMSYMIQDITDQHAVGICTNLGIDTLQHLGELEQEDIIKY